MDLQKETEGRFGILEFFAKKEVEGFITGLHKSPYHGFSVEFAEHRAYNQGQSTRHIDWKLYARTDKLYVKQYEEETNLRAQLIIDVSGSMFYPTETPQLPDNSNKAGFAAYASAVLTDLFRRQRDGVGLTLMDDEIRESQRAKTSGAHIRHIFYTLEKLIAQKSDAAGTSTKLIKNLHLLAEKFPKRSLVILFTDLFDRETDDWDEILKALQHFKYHKHEVILFHTYHAPTELDFEVGTRPLKLVDMETGETLKIQPQDIKSVYRQEMQKHFSQIKLRCGQYGIEFVEADISKGFSQVLLPLLIKRSRMY